MPVKSQAQRRLMFAAQEGKVPGIKPSVGTDFINASKGLKNLPARVPKPRAPRLVHPGDLTPLPKMHTPTDN